MEYYQQAFDSSPDGLLVVDPQGLIVQANAQACTLFGYASGELDQQMIEALVPKHRRRQHIGHREHYGESPHPRAMGGQGLQLAGLRKDGSEFSVDVMLSPLRGNIGPMTLCVVRDVTERVHTERLMRDLLESAPDAMVIVNAQGRIELVNSQTETVFGFARQELLGQPIEVLIPQRFRAHHPQYRSGYHANPRVRPMGEELQLYGLRKDGSEMPIEISLSPLKTSNGTLVVSAIRDISSRKRAEQLILDSLKEKEVLLKEIHHRVKNNLAVISSLFSLQSNNLDDEHLKTILRQSQDRVRSMALVHETLYSHNLAEVDFTEYVTSLSAQLLTNYSLSTGQVQLVTELEPILLSIDMAVPCGLILNELVTNALKHGLQDGRAGRLLVALRRTEPGRFELEVSDDGCGLPPDFDLASGNSLGKRLIRSLVKQLNGQVQFTSAQPGTRVLLTLPLPARKESGT